MNKQDFISVFWAWNADPDVQRVKEQLSAFADKKINNVFIHARAGLKICYMGEKWFEAFAAAIEVAEKRGIHVWIYDENGWPSGFGGGEVYDRDDSFKERYLLSCDCTADEFASLGIDVSDVLFAYVKEGDGFRSVSVKEAVSSRKRHLFVYAKVNDYYVDITNPEAVDCFIHVTHERYAERFGQYFGNVIPGVFTDEPHVSPVGVPYGKYIVGEYENIYGEKFADAVPYLFHEVGAYRRYRYRFHRLIGKLIKENYTAKINEWCNRHGLLLTGHFACEEGLASQICAAGKVMPLYREMGIVGVDALGNRLIPAVAYRQAMSVAWQFGDRDVLCETFAGTGYDATFSELLRIWAYQAVNGITLPCFSISVMSLEGNRKRDYPQFFSEQMPWWEKADVLFDSVNFINRNIKGERQPLFLVVQPMSGMECEYGVRANESAVAISASFRNLTENLLANQVEFDYGDEGMIADSAEIKGTSLVLGNVSYPAVILAENINAESGVLEKIRRFALAGGKVYVVGPLPAFTDGEPSKPAFDFPYEILINRKDYIRKLISGFHRPPVGVFDINERLLSNFFMTALRRDGEGEKLFVLNPSRSGCAEGRIRAKGRLHATLVTESGERPLGGFYDAYAGEREFPLSLRGMEYCFVRFAKGAPALPAHADGTVFLNPARITAGSNFMAVDVASLSVDGGDYGEEQNIIHLTSSLYNEINGKGEKTISVRYRFNVGNLPSALLLHAETGDGTLAVNGRIIHETTPSFNSDFRTYNIVSFAKKGTNEVVITKKIPAFSSDLLGKDVFQSITNVFSFPYYIESLVLQGDFGVACTRPCATMTQMTTAGGFEIVNYPNLHAGNLTEQGLPFFAGKVQAEYVVDYSGGNVRVVVPNTCAVYAELELNGRNYPVYAGGKIDVTEGLVMGKNRLNLTLYASFRNLFGPLHHVYGKHFYTGPSVFEGYAEYQDAVVYPELKGETFTDNYSFVPLVVPPLGIEYSGCTLKKPAPQGTR